MDTLPHAGAADHDAGTTLARLLEEAAVSLGELRTTRATTDLRRSRLRHGLLATAAAIRGERIVSARLDGNLLLVGQGAHRADWAALCASCLWTGDVADTRGHGPVLRRCPVCHGRSFRIAHVGEEVTRG